MRVIPEVEGTLGQIPGPVILVQTEADVNTLDLAEDTPIAYVTQTTLSVDEPRGSLRRCIVGLKTSSGPVPRTSAMRHRTAKLRCWS